MNVLIWNVSKYQGGADFNPAFHIKVAKRRSCLVAVAPRKSIERFVSGVRLFQGLVMSSVDSSLE